MNWMLDTVPDFKNCAKARLYQPGELLSAFSKTCFVEGDLRPLLQRIVERPLLDIELALHHIYLATGQIQDWLAICKLLRSMISLTASAGIQGQGGLAYSRVLAPSQHDRLEDDLNSNDRMSALPSCPYVRNFT